MDYHDLKSFFFTICVFPNYSDGFVRLFMLCQLAPIEIVQQLVAFNQTPIDCISFFCCFCISSIILYNVKTQ